jgi:hypothetical protein
MDRPQACSLRVAANPLQGGAACGPAKPVPRQLTYRPEQERNHASFN